VALRIHHHSKVAAEGLRQGKPELRRQGAPVRMRIVVLENREDKPVMASPARRRLAQRPANREWEEKEGKGHTASPERRRLAQCPADREGEEKEGKAPMVSPAGRQGADRLLGSSPDRGNQSAERKKAKQRLRRLARNSLALL